MPANLKKRENAPLTRKMITLLLVFAVVTSFGIFLGPRCFRTLSIAYKGSNVEKTINPHLSSNSLLARTLPYPTPKNFVSKPVKGAPLFCYSHSLMTPDNYGGVYMVALGLNDTSVLEGDAGSSILHYKADGSIETALAANPRGLRPSPVGLGLNSANTLYLSVWDYSKKLSPEILQLPVGRILDFPKNQKVEPFIGMTSKFPINLWDHYNKFPDIFEHVERIVGNLIHLSVDRKDNLYLGFWWSKKDAFEKLNFQITLIKVDPAQNVVRVGEFPIGQINPQNGNWIYYYHGRMPGHEALNFSLTVDSSDNVFVHQNNVLLEFKKLAEGYDRVEVLATIKSQATLRSIASSPNGALYALQPEQQTVWDISLSLMEQPFFEIPHQLGTGHQPLFKNAQEIACDALGRLFVYDKTDHAIVVYK
jgi:hypothetical protein